KAQFTGDESMIVAYLFRVHNMVALVWYAGPTGGADVQSQALSIARKQEAKLWATLNPPAPAQPTPTAAPIVAPATNPASVPIPGPQAAPVGAAAPAPVAPAPIAPA